jgi:hypothetical protein
MSIYNYFLVGVCFTMFIDVMLWVCKDHPKIIKVHNLWGHGQRIANVLLWPVTSTYFLYAFIISIFRK